MKLSQPFSINTNEVEEEDFGQLSRLVGSSISMVPNNQDVKILNNTSKKKKKKKKAEKTDTVKTETLSNGVEIVLADESVGLEMMQSDMPYAQTYNDTTHMLKSAVTQMDIISNEVKEDLDEIRSSRRLKNKYRYITDMANTLSSLVTSKVTAIREINSVITNAHKLELQRMKDTGAYKATEQDDDKMIMDMYNSFISMPGHSTQGFNPPTMNAMTDPMSLNIIRAGIGNNDSGYENYQQNMSPQFRKMKYENDPNVQTVIIYDKSSGRRWFDVIDVSTGQSIPGIEKPDQMFLEDTTLDLNSGVARNVNLDQTWNIRIIGDTKNSKY